MASPLATELSIYKGNTCTYNAPTIAGIATELTVYNTNKSTEYVQGKLAEWLALYTYWKFALYTYSGFAFYTYSGFALYSYIRFAL